MFALKPLERYHINPETGVSGKCKAKKKPCPFGELFHYTNENVMLKVSELLASGDNSTLPKSLNKNESKEKIRTQDITFEMIRPDAYRKNEDHYYQYWLLTPESKDPIGYIKLNEKDNYVTSDGASGITLCDIEINPEFSGRGAGDAIVQKILENFGVEKIYTTGNCTPEGFKFVYRQIKKGTMDFLHGYKENHERGGWFPGFNPITFVESWEEKVPKY